MTALVFDIGGTRVKAGIAQAGGISRLTTVETDVSSPDALVAQVAAIGKGLLGDTAPSAVGVGVKGIVDTERGSIIEVNSPLDLLRGEPLADRLAKAFGAPVRIDNDARLYALGEFRAGAGRGAESIVCLTVGTGVGVGVVVDGELLRSPRGTLGILGGHITVDVHGPRCTCGNIGCLEALIGTEGFVGDARSRVARNEGSSPEVSTLTPKRIFALAAEGDPAAVAAVEHFTRLLSCGVVSLIHVYDPDVVVIGGGVSGSASEFLDGVQRFCDEHAWTQPKGRVRVVRSALGDEAALFGAAELVDQLGPTEQ